MPFDLLDIQSIYRRGQKKKSVQVASSVGAQDWFSPLLYVPLCLSHGLSGNSAGGKASTSLYENLTLNIKRSEAEAKITMCKINKLQEYSVHYREYSQYFIAVLNGVQSIKILRLYCTPATNIIL